MVVGFLLSTAIFSGSVFAGSPDGEYFLQVNKSIDVFGRVYKEITSNYVDEINPGKFMNAGIEAMLASLDPYTVYIDKEEGDEVELLTSGKYGGIGVTIGYRENSIQVITVMDGYSAQRQGVLPGDRILEVDGLSVADKKPEEVRNLTRGTPGTEVRLLISREGEPEPLLFVLIREEIRLKNVTYNDYMRDGIGYVRVERFSRKAGEEMRQAIKDLQARGQLSGLVIDVRGNPGGLLDAAVDVVSKFVPKGTLIVSTRGRRPDADKEYRSVEEPLLPDVPLVVLTDRGSASASEIVAGSMQDLDRALIVGERTFGKGLVQTILPLNFGAQLKVTTARYYTPSGRSIQEVDYERRDGLGMFTAYADSTRREFRTMGGRKVYEHGGISPDSTVLPEGEGPMIEALKRKSLFFRFVNKYLGEAKDSILMEITDAMLSEFKSFLREVDFDFDEKTGAKLKELRSTAEELHYGQAMIANLDKLSQDFEREKERAFERYEDHIKHYLEVELASRTGGEQGRIAASLKGDSQLEVAVRLLKDKNEYEEKIRG
jgi:carboxyl-terminal processing protease